MTTDSTDFDDEALVAFLDGELPEDQAIALRQQLARDPALKKRVEDLKASWNLLDQLPAANANPQLAQSTIELITQGLIVSEQNKSTSIVLKYRWLWASLALLLTLLGGMWVAREQDRAAKQAIVDDLFVLTHFRELDNIDSLSWLNALESIQHLERAGLPLYNSTNYPELPKKSVELKTWAGSLNPTQKLEMQNAFKSFDLATSDRKKVLREIAATVQKPESKKTFDAIKAYTGLMSRLGTTEAIQISGEEDLKRRSSAIQHVIRREVAIGYSLSKDEKDHIVDWCDRLKEGNFYFLNAEDPDGEIIRVLDVESPDSNIQAQDIENLIQCIAPIGRELLAALEPPLQTKVLKLWIINSLPTIQQRPQYSSAELLSRFQELPTSAQNDLIYLPTAEVIKALSKGESATSNDAAGRP